VRKKNKSLKVLLVTSRETERWVIPKGWPSKRMTDAAAAAREARQEAGVTGKVSKEACGSYRYRKLGRAGARIVEVDAYVLQVKKERKTWRERGQRQRGWFEKEEAARKVREPGLKALILKL
jgi:8-oxo-dGTP pyrophosphatase MutT (NUDIX family)